MAIDTDIFEDDLTGIIADMPATLVSGDDTVSCTKSELTEAADLQMAGPLADDAVEVMAKVSDFTTVPSEGGTVTLDGTTYKIDRTMKSCDGKAIHLFLRANL